MNFLEQAGNELNTPANKLWREEAQYERHVIPLLARLQAIDWSAVVALHSARWHRKAIDEIQGRKQRYGCYCWVGAFFNPSTGAYRQIQRYSLLYLSDYGAYPVRLCLAKERPVSSGWFHPSDLKNPEWTPEAYASHAYKNYREMYGQALRNIEDEESFVLNRRQYIADRLLNISRQLGKYVRKNYWNANGMFYEESYELTWNLKEALTSNKKSGYLSAIDPATLGEVEAKLGYFWQCLKEFHEEETTTTAVTAKALNPQLSTPHKPDTDSQLVRDTYLHFPGVFESFAGLDEPEGLRQWAMHLADLWANPRQHSAPSDYDAAYYNQSGEARAEFLAALRLIQATAWLALRAPRAERELFEGRGLIPDGESKELRGEALMTLATRGATWLLAWLGWREQQPTRQLLTALGTIELANANLVLTSREAERPPCLFVPDSSPAVEARRFTNLLAEFRQHLPSKRAKLRLLLAELKPLRVLPLELLHAGPASGLPARFSMLAWPRLSKYPADCALAETFWPDLEQALRTRAEWAAKAYDVVAVALGETLKPDVNNIAPTSNGLELGLPQPEQPPGSRPWPEIEALAERIELRRNGAFLPAPKWIAAATAGMIDALCEAEILPPSGELERLYTDFTRHYGCSIKADRVNPTRASWQKKARKALGLE